MCCEIWLQSDGWRCSCPGHISNGMPQHQDITPHIMRTNMAINDHGGGRRVGGGAATMRVVMPVTAQAVSAEDVAALMDVLVQDRVGGMRQGVRLAQSLEAAPIASCQVLQHHNVVVASCRLPGSLPVAAV